MVAAVVTAPEGAAGVIPEVVISASAGDGDGGGYGGSLGVTCGDRASDDGGIPAPTRTLLRARSLRSVRNFLR